MPMIACRTIQTVGTALGTVLVAVLVSCISGERSASVSSWVVESVPNSSGELRAVVTKERPRGARSSDVTIVSIIDREGSRQVNQDRILVLAGAGAIDVRWQTPAILSVICKRCGIPLAYATKRKDNSRSVSIRYEEFPSEQAATHTESLLNPSQTVKAIVVSTGQPNADFLDSQIVELQPSTRRQAVPTQAQSMTPVAPPVAIAVEGARRLQVRWQDDASLFVSCSECLTGDSKISDKKTTVLGVKIIYSGLQ